MSTDDTVIAAAEALGRELASHPVVQKLEGLVKELEADTEAKRLMADLRRQEESLLKKEASGQPIEVADKHRRQELQQSVAMNPLLGRLQAAQMDYVDLMRKIDGLIGGSGAGS
ncbi:MAG: YlbF family regulator [Planctomycetota bacterium]